MDLPLVLQRLARRLVEKLKKTFQRQCDQETWTEPSSKLGQFGRLPYELREQIWDALAPTGREVFIAQREWDEENSGQRKANFNILCANRFFHDEVSEVIYRRSTLEFDINPFYRPKARLCKVFYKSKFRPEDEKVTAWHFDSVDEARDSGFGHFPLHRLDEVIVNIPSPDPEDFGELFCLWTKIRDIVNLLSGWTRVNRLVVRLQKDGWRNWLDYDGEPSVAYSASPVHSSCIYDHDVAILPFAALRNLKCLEVKTYSHEFTNSMDWAVINWLEYLVEKNEETARADLDRKAAHEFYWMHEQAYLDVRGFTSCFVRLELVRQWALYGSRAGFESEMMRIMDEYPEFIDGDIISALRTMHNAEVMRKITAFAPELLGEDIGDVSLSIGILQSSVVDNLWYGKLLLLLARFVRSITMTDMRFMTFNRALRRWEARCEKSVWERLKAKIGGRVNVGRGRRE
ncbi:hypothetical protein AJ79_06707 [Helicocarpus griseus UAMH5409]|uniref:Uncharacterized protein n=1 Tax=Helicocarpus griseus UAMH5409 TaxID=1447875 RepID=A0A2B7XA53_9EURO|nr:hypothetical protein AJ79_06707 [Helicocarpus griseus UAMH5409]